MTNEEQIRAWAIAVHQGDLDAVVADHASDIVMFAAYRDGWPPFLTWLGRGAVFQIESLEVTAGIEVAVAYALRRCGRPTDLARDPEQRLRLTLGLRKASGHWIVTHEHHSFPDATGPDTTSSPDVAARS